MKRPERGSTDSGGRQTVLTGHCARTSYGVPLLVEPIPDAHRRTGALSLVPNNHDDCVGYLISDRRVIIFSVS